MLRQTWQPVARRNTATAILILVVGLISFVAIVVGFGLPVVLTLVLFVACVGLVVVAPLARRTWGDPLAETESTVTLKGAILLPGDGEAMLPRSRARAVRGTLTFRAGEVEWQPLKPSTEETTRPFTASLLGPVRVARSLQAMALAVPLLQGHDLLFATSRHSRRSVERALERIQVTTSETAHE